TVRTLLDGVIERETKHFTPSTKKRGPTPPLPPPETGTASENARLYERVAENEARLEGDLEAARKLQQHLLPACCPQVEGLEIAAAFEPARQIGGGLYDFVTFPHCRPGITPRDASGEGGPSRAC